MIKIELKKKDKKELTAIRRKTDDPRSERALAVLLCSDGWSPPKISGFLKRHYNTVASWLKQYSKVGISSLSRKYSPGRPSERASVFIPLLENWLSKSPDSYGYKNGQWNVKLLIEQYRKETGSVLSEDTVERALKDAGYSYKKPKKVVSSKAPSKEDKVKAVNKIIGQVQELLKKDAEVFCLDETHFSTEPYLMKGWYKKGVFFSSGKFTSKRKLHDAWCVQSGKKTFLLEGYTQRQR